MKNEKDLKCNDREMSIKTRTLDAFMSEFDGDADIFFTELGISIFEDSLEFYIDEGVDQDHILGTAVKSIRAVKAIRDICDIYIKEMSSKKCSKTK